VAILLLGCAGLCPAQSIDAFAGLNALTASQAVQNIPRLGGGLFPSAGANIFLGDIGIGGEVAFRGSQNNFQGTQFRPIYYDVNLVLDPIHINPAIVPELMVGIGAQSLRAYTGLTQCGTLSGCTTYASSNHLTAHVGVALKLYVIGHLFVRPEAHFYFIRHNFEFQTANSERFGVSIGYTLGGS